MLAIPALSPHWAHQENVSMAGISDELERMWGESEE